MRFIRSTRRGRALGLLLLSVAAGAVAPAAQADAAYEIKPRHTSNQCLDVPHSDLADGRGLIQWGCNNQPNQRFSLVTTHDGYWKIVAVHSNKCLSVRGASTANGANIEQSSCIEGAAHQRFSLIGFGGGYYSIAVKHSGKCFDIAGANQSPGTKLQQWGCHYGANQQFLFIWR